MCSLRDGAPPTISLLPFSVALTLPLFPLDATFPEAETFAEIRWKSGLSYKFHATARRHARHANLFANSFVTSESTRVAWGRGRRMPATCGAPYNFHAKFDRPEHLLL